MRTILRCGLALGLTFALAQAGYAKSPASSTKTGKGATASGITKSKTRTSKTARTHHSKTLPARPGIHRRHTSFVPNIGPMMYGMMRPVYAFNPFTYWPDRNGPVAIYSGSGSGHHHSYAYHRSSGRHHHSGHRHHRRV